jgi:hypothetical protein
MSESGRPGGTDGDEMDAEGATTTVLSLER